MRSRLVRESCHTSNSRAPERTRRWPKTDPLCPLSATGSIQVRPPSGDRLPYKLPRLCRIVRAGQTDLLGPGSVTPPLVGQGHLLRRSECHVGVQGRDAWFARKQFQQLLPRVAGRRKGEEDSAPARPEVGPTLPETEHLAIWTGEQSRQDLVGSDSRF